jgi:predicted amidohydrolase
MTRQFRAAAVQMLATSDKEANLSTAEKWVREAATRGASLVVLPEVFNWRGRASDTLAFAEPIPGLSSDRMAGLARELDIYILAGSILEQVGEGQRVFNTSMLIDPTGRFVAKYRKIHLFDVNFDGDLAISESTFRQPGGEAVVVQTALCTLGLSVCYDLRFPELYRVLSQRGAQVVVVPSVFTVPTGESHWETLLRARAIENQVYVIAPDQIGQHPSSMDAYGHSMIVDPWGKIVAQAETAAGIVCADVDLDYLEEIRRKLPALKHRKM